MTREEVIRLLADIKALYPSFYAGAEGIPDLVIEQWHSAFQQQTFSDARTALSSYYGTDVRGFAPKPGNLLPLMPITALKDEPLASSGSTSKTKLIADERCQELYEKIIGLEELDHELHLARAGRLSEIAEFLCVNPTKGGGVQINSPRMDALETLRDELLTSAGYPADYTEESAIERAVIGRDRAPELEQPEAGVVYVCRGVGR